MENMRNVSGKSIKFSHGKAWINTHVCHACRLKWSEKIFEKYAIPHAPQTYNDYEEANDKLYEMPILTGDGPLWT